MLPAVEPEIYLFRDAVFDQDHLLPCFWCDKPVYRTNSYVDHLISKLKGGKSNPNNLRIACHPCAWERQSFSHLAAVIRRQYQNTAKVPIGKRRVKMAHYLKERESILAKLLKWETCYHQRLGDPEHAKALRICLREIDEILKAEMI